jgi:hypothetical protein
VVIHATKPAGSINATAIARIYFDDGQFLRYAIHDAPLEGETIPEHVLQALFPLAEFQGKRVIIHRDSYYRGAEKEDLKSWAQKIGATFYLVEVIKTGAPRIYARQRGRIQQPTKARSFKLSDTDAFLISSLPPCMFDIGPVLIDHRPRRLADRCPLGLGRP